MTNIPKFRNQGESSSFERIILCSEPFISTVFSIMTYLCEGDHLTETEMVHREASTPEPRKNKLNELSGKDWIKFTKSWFVHRPEPHGDRKIRHPASFPESLVKDFISFFTRQGELVVDPFLGTGTTLVTAVETRSWGTGLKIVKTEPN